LKTFLEQKNPVTLRILKIIPPVMKKIFLVLNLFLLIFISSTVTKAENPVKRKSALKEGDYVAGTIIIKVKSSARVLCNLNSIDEPKIQQAFARIGAGTVSKMFPRALVAEGMKNSMGKPFVDLSLVYRIKYAGNLPVEVAINYLRATGIVEYAEPQYVQHYCFTPNDPSLGSQYAITKINALNAWNVWQGDTNTVIGIVDSGTDPNHPDLKNNIKYNYADPVDGIDNDNDGFVDNFVGWDISENDNDATVGAQVHGSHVSGCADATTNNGVGVASPGFKCKFLPVKCALDASTSAIDNGFEGITYAADHGCSVINCSWGRAGGPSQFEQDVINYASVNHDAVVVVAAGNDNSQEDFYPANYENAVSIAATGTNDARASFSNYGYGVDACAPGNNIYSTVYNDSYVNMSGTSMASPIAAGCVAMIRSKFPAYNAAQAAIQLRVTCDDIYSVPANAGSTYANKLGKGRVNLYKALTDSVSEGIQVTNLNITDGNDDAFVINDTLKIGALFTSLLQPASNLTVVLSTTSTYVNIINNTFNIGALNTFASASNSGNPFRVRINPTAPANSTVTLKMTMTDGTYTDFFVFNVVVNVDYLNINVNDVATSITSIGRIGYNSPGQLQGIGFTYMGGGSLLYEAGLMTGVSSTRVSNNVRGAVTGNTDNDYQSVSVVERVIPGVSAFDAYGKFNDAIAATGTMNILITHRAYAWTSAADRNYIMVHYTIKNNGASALNNFYAGIYADWDVLPNYANNRATVDMTRKLGYAYSTDVGGFYAGIKLLSAGGFNHYAIDNDGTGTGGFSVYDGYDIGEKYTSLSSSRTDAGVTGTGIDVSDVVSSGPFTINAGDSVIVAFALLASNDLTTLQSGADAAQIMYDGMSSVGVQEISMTHDFYLNQSFPNPSSGQTTISFALPESNHTELAIYNMLGEKIKTILNEKLNAGTYSVVVDLSSVKNGNYLYRLSSGADSKTLPVIISH
jgi:serine protease